MMRIIQVLVVIFFLLISPEKVFSQLSKNDYEQFFEAVRNKNDSLVISKGEEILKVIQKYPLKIDSTLIELRVFTALAHSNLRNYNRSVELNLKTFDLIENNNNIVNDYLLVACMHNLALAKSMLEENEDALNWNLKSVSYIRRTSGSNNNLYISELSNLAEIYSDLYKDSISLTLNMEVLNYYQNSQETDFKNIAKSLNNISLNYTELGKYKLALDYIKKALDVIKMNLGEVNKSYASYLHNYADINFNLGLISKAIEITEYSAEIKKKIYGPNHGEYALTLSSLAHYYSDIGNSTQALNIKLDVVRIIKDYYGENHSNYANSLSSLAVEYDLLGDDKMSLEYNLKALKIRGNVFGVEHPDYAISLSNIAHNYSNMGDFDKSINYTQMTLDVIVKYFGENNLRYSRAISDLALEYSNRGDYEIALKLNYQALDIINRIRGENNKDYATTLNNIAINYSGLGEFNKSIEFHTEALNIKKNIYGDSNINCAINLMNLASIYDELCLFSKALELNLEAKTIIELFYGKNHSEYAQVLFSIAGNHFHLQNYELAIDINTQALNIRIRNFGRNHPLISASLNNIALILSENSDFKKALKLNKKSFRIIRNSFGIESREYALILNNLGLNYYKLERFKKSLNLYSDALIIKEKVYGKDDNYANTLLNLSECYNKLGRTKEAISASRQSLEIFRNNYDFLSYTMPNDVMVKYKQKLDHVFNYSLNLSINLGQINNELYNQWISINGLLYLNSMLKDKSNVTDFVLKNNLNIIKSLKSKLHLNLEVVDNKDSKSIKDLQDSILIKEIEIRKNISENNCIDKTLFTSDLAISLSEKSVFIDFVCTSDYNFKFSNWTDNKKYLVFISDFKDTLVDFVVIEDLTKIDQELFDQYKQEAANSQYKTELKDNSFYNSFWKPIADKIGDAKTIYVSLGGVYNNINLNTLYNPETGKYLIEEKDIRIVNSARDFVLSKEQEKKIYTTNTAALFGFPDFNGNTTVAVDSTDFLASTRDLNPFWLDSLTRGGLKANPLPATKIEVENISLTLKSKGWQVNSYLAENASETNIKKQESPRILHIATHGYFFPDIPIDKDNTRFLGMDRQQVVQDPMLRSGLLFTGANRTLKGEESKGENGLLSAAEASLLDLRETELVVLSACETGKGEVKNSEGVYGLRKAFSDAGAKNIIMSLWKVDDKVTQEFMSRFYEIWLNDKTSIREAFNKTQLEIKAKYPEPYYWGAFILVGE
jgi:CHAT domain-containing protein/Tfp pilus assembly protein PilF